MNRSKQRRKEARAAVFAGHIPDETYKSEANPDTEPTTTGREWDAERSEKPAEPGQGKSGPNESPNGKHGSHESQNQKRSRGVKREESSGGET
jgi:hypothetical protein